MRSSQGAHPSSEGPFPGPVDLPMDGELDLHTFRPRDVPAVVEEYIAECRRRGIRRIRIIHGKGIGQLRETVHQLLKDHPGVESYRLAGAGMGGWGATLVDLQCG